MRKLDAMRRMLSATILGLLAVASIPGRASGQQLIALDGGGGLFRIDPRTGEAAWIGSTGLQAELWTGLAQDFTGRLFASYGYWDTPFQIYEIDPLSGRPTFVLQTNFIGISSIAFGPGGLLYVTNMPTNPTAGDYYLHAVDLLTGATTLVGNTGITAITALDFDAQGRLWAFAAYTGLVEIDLATGAARDVNPTFQGPPDLSKSMVFGEDDALWMLDLGLWIGDRSTGVPSLIAPVSIINIFGGMEYVAGPKPPFSLWTTGETGGPMSIRVTGATPHGIVGIAYARGAGGPTPIPPGRPCAGTLLDLNAGFSSLRVLQADAQGRAQMGPAYVPLSVAPTTHLQAVDLATCLTSNHARIIF